MPKFFVDENQIINDKIYIVNSDKNHIVNVLRKKIDDELIICDCNSYDYNCKIIEILDDKITLAILSKSLSLSEPKTNITLFQALPKQSKMEDIITKTVEVGVHEIVPIYTEFCVVKINEKSKNKTDRWQKISKLLQNNQEEE